MCPNTVKAALQTRHHWGQRVAGKRVASIVVQGNDPPVAVEGSKNCYISKDWQAAWQAANDLGVAEGRYSSYFQ